MKTRAITAMIGWSIAIAVSIVIWLFVMVAIVHVFGCSLTVSSGELTGLRHHHTEDEAEPTPTPARVQ